MSDKPMSEERLQKICEMFLGTESFDCSRLEAVLELRDEIRRLSEATAQPEQGDVERAREWYNKSHQPISQRYGGIFETFAAYAASEVAASNASIKFAEIWAENERLKAQVTDLCGIVERNERLQVELSQMRQAPGWLRVRAQEPIK